MPWPLELMETGVDGILVGVGPGAACTTREVTGVGVPQVSATLECAAARQDYFHRTGRYVSVITDGGIRTGGDMCKAIASGADGVMVGDSLRPGGRGLRAGATTGAWQTPMPSCPGAPALKVGTKATLKEIMYGPHIRYQRDPEPGGGPAGGHGDVRSLHNNAIFHQVEMVIAPAIKTEGKFYQLSE